MNKILSGSSFNHYIFGESFSYEELRTKLSINKDKIILSDKKVNFNSLRLKTFINKSNICVSCKRVGTIFRLQKDRTSINYHVGLWSEDNVQMTKDHKTPKSKGGKDTFKNMQCMCEICNKAKGNKNGKINSTDMIYNNFNRLENLKEEIITFNRTNKVNVFKSIEKYPKFKNHYEYFMKYGLELWDYFGGQPSRKNKYWSKLDSTIKEEIKNIKK